MLYSAAKKLCTFSTFPFKRSKNEQAYTTTSFLNKNFVSQVDIKSFFNHSCIYFSEKKISDVYNIDILIFLSTSIENNMYELADYLLDKYIHYHGTKDIEKFLIISHYVKQKNIIKNEIEKATNVYNKLVYSRHNNLFENIIKNKSIAIVGNSPSEISKNSGEEIDSYDIVIRFNNYQTKGYERDYGTKTNIWVKCSSSDIQHQVKAKDLNLIIYEPDYMHHQVLYNYLDVLNLNQHPIDYLDFHDHAVLRKKLGIFPTTGILIIEKVLNIVDITSVKCFGFSFLEEKCNNISTHYFNDRSLEEDEKRSKNHNYMIENTYLNNKFNKEIL